ncbi:MAG: glycosyltransferase family 1 protein [Prevotella sp.]|nr:glycosyltransferase family 1 protein [Prevotella sp.]
MKILLFGEYSNVHHTLAEGLKVLGHEVLLVSGGDFWKNYPRDIDVARRPGKIGGLLLMAKISQLLPRLRSFDVVQIINPIFIDLKAEHLFPLYRYLRRHNRKMVMGAFGMDYYWVKVNTDDRPLRYSDFNFGDKIRHDTAAEVERRDWIGTPKGRLNQMIAHDCDAIVTGLYEYQATYGPLFPDKTKFIPFPIQPPCTTATSALKPQTTPVRVFVGLSKERSTYKGTDIMLRAAQDVERKYPERLRVLVAEGLPFDQYQALMNGSDILLDQLYSYTPAMNALLAMQKGLVVVGGGEPENYEILGERELRPIVNVQPDYDSVYGALEQLALHPELLPQLKADSQEYIRRHHDFVKVARQYETLYETLLCT